MKLFIKISLSAIAVICLGIAISLVVASIVKGRIDLLLEAGMFVVVSSLFRQTKQDDDLMDQIDGRE